MFRRYSAYLILCLLAILFAGDANTTAQDRALKPGESVEIELRDGQSQSFKLSLTPLDYVRLSVNTRSQEIAVKIIAPGGKEVAARDLSRDSAGGATVSFVAGYWGDFRLEITSREKVGSEEKIEIKFAESRTVEPQDADRIAAEGAFAEGENFRSREVNEERRPAIAKYEEALSLWRKLDDRDGQGRATNALARIHANLNEGDKALDYYDQALRIRREIKDRAGEASSLSGLAEVYNGRGERQKALDLFRQALQIRRELQDRRGEAAALFNLGAVYQRLNQPDQALEYYQQSLQIRREVKDRRGEASSLFQIGVISGMRGNLDHAFESYQQALAVFRDVDDKRNEAIALSSIGVYFLRRGKPRESLEYLERALEIQHALGALRQEAVTLSNLGGAYDDLGEGKRALVYFNRALKIRREIPDPTGVANTLHGMGNVYFAMGEYRSALDHFKQAQPLMRATGGPAGEAQAINGIGLVYKEMGERQTALDYLQQGLERWRAVKYRSEEAVALTNIGQLYNALREHEAAIDYFNQALEVHRELRNPVRQASTLVSLGVASHAKEEKEKALDYFNQALKLANDNRFVTANALNASGLVYKDLEDPQQALDHFNRALALTREISARTLEAETLHNIGWVYRSTKDLTSARNYLSQSLEIYRDIGIRASEAATLFGLANIDNDAGELKAARSQIEGAIEIAESLRAGLGSQELRASYFASVQKYYDLYIEVLMKIHEDGPNRGSDAEALRVSERARARSLLDLLNESGADIRQGVEKSLLERERELQELLSAKAARQTQLRLAKAPQSQIDEISAEIQKLAAEYQTVQSRIRTTSPRYAALTQPRPLTAKDIQEQVLDRESLLLEYSLGDRRSFLWAVTPTSLRSYTLPKRDVVEQAAREVYELLTERNHIDESESPAQQSRRISQADARLSAAMARLSRMLLAPVASQLGNKRLIIVAQGTLQYVPFAALPIPRSGGAGDNGRRGQGDRRTRGPRKSAISNQQSVPLIVNHEIVNLPSASTIAVLRRETANRKPAEKTLAVFADPVFEKDDERLTKVALKPEMQKAQNTQQTRLLKHAANQFSGRIPRLPFTRQEANSILSLVPEAEARPALDFTANRASVTESDLSRYRYIHFATHGLLNSQNPELSSIVLSLVDDKGQTLDGFLRALEVYNLNLPAEAVVLSACETGLGKQVKGEGLVGLTRGFMYAGAPRVVVSLWSVNDKATADLMSRFYRKMLTDGERPASALRAAQVEMWKQQQWQAPYYWAAFVLQGEWR